MAGLAVFAKGAPRVISVCGGIRKNRVPCHAAKALHTAASTKKPKMASPTE